MKKNYIIIMLIILVFSIHGCVKKNLIFKTIYLDKAFSIVPIVTILDEKNKIESVNLSEELSNITNSLDEKFNVFKEKSLISIVNKNAGIIETYVDDEFIFVLSEAIKISQETIIEGKSLYDVSIFTIWKEWNFKDNYYQLDNYSEIPDNKIIKQKLPLVNYKDIIIDYEKKTVLLNKKEMMIDLGSIVKGYAADKISSYLKEKNFDNCLIDVGGNIITMGKNIGTNKKWKAGILMPFSFDTEIGYIETNDIKETLVTSGIYERYLIYLDENNNKIMYHHILNPLTGYPENNELTSVTIITDKSISADGYSTAIFLMGLEEGLRFVNNNKSIEAIFITKQKEIYLSDNIKTRFIINEKIINYGYKLI